MKNFAREKLKIAKFLLKKGLSIRFVAEKIGVHCPTVSRIHSELEKFESS